MDFYFDYSCPYAYLASTWVETRRPAEFEVVRKPILLGGVFRAVATPQNLMGTLAPAKATHNGNDMMRWAGILDAPLAIPAAHPLRTVEALRVTLATGIDPKVVERFYRAYWVENAPVSDESVIRRVLADTGHDADAILARASTHAIKSDLRARTDEAIARGVFGVPAFYGDGRLTWGCDRIHLLTNRSFEETYKLPPRPRTSSMAKHKLDFYWDFSSPFAYLGASQVDALAERTGATVTWQPMLLGGVFRDIGQVDAPILTWGEAKRRYTLEDVVRWAAYWKVPFRFPSRFPMNSLKALRCYLALPEERRKDFRERTFRAYWADDRDISDDEVLRELIGDDADRVFAKTKEASVKEELIARTKAAVERGVFGAPTWIVDDKELFWGQDRIFLVERALES